MKATLSRTLQRNPFLMSLLLLILMVAINRSLQENLFDIGPLNNNLRVFMPAILLAVGQTFVVVAGGVDMSIGAILSMTNAILATQIPQDATPEVILGAFALAFIAGILAGALNGFGVTVLRLQPIVTTYATSFIFTGIALKILPEPGGRLPRELTSFWRSPLPLNPEAEVPFAIPNALIVIVILILLWIIISNTRFKQYLFATGSKPDAAYATGVPVNRVKFSTYVLAGFFATLGALAMTLGSGTGNPRAGDSMTLPSVVAVVLGGTALSGGHGNIVGSIIGALIYGLISNIISFANIDSWVRPLVDALIIITALAIPAVIGLVRRLRE